MRAGRTAARVAAALALTSAAVSLYWTLGGELLLDTVGGAMEDLARERSAGAIALGAAVVVLKTAAGCLALATARTRSRAVLAAGAAGAAVLVLWGGANVVVGGMVLGGIIEPATEVDRHALRWHVLFWDPWFVVWGLALAAAVAAARR